MRWTMQAVKGTNWSTASLSKFLAIIIRLLYTVDGNKNYARHRFPYWGDPCCRECSQISWIPILPVSERLYCLQTDSLHCRHCVDDYKMNVDQTDKVKIINTKYELVYQWAVCSSSTTYTCTCNDDICSRYNFSQLNYLKAFQTKHKYRKYLNNNTLLPSNNELDNA